jgi:hypothetical protein
MTESRELDDEPKTISRNPNCKGDDIEDAEQYALSFVTVYLPR